MVENTREAVTPSGVLADGDRASAMGGCELEVVYHIDGKEVTKEEWLQLQQEWENQRKQRQEKAKENMNNGNDLDDHEEGVGDNHHNDGNPPHEETISTIKFPPFYSQLVRPP